ncbi:Outer membrane protein A precursor [compost metagenome]
MFKATRNTLRFAVVAAALATITACTSTVSKVDSQGMTQEPVFPAVSKATRPDGSYVNQENLGKIADGMTKAQIQELIGPPQFKEGMFGVREWDYILKFRQPNGQPDKVCQYKVLFDKDMLARSFHFQPADCLAQAEEPAPARAESLTLSADTTFAFGSAVLSPRGETELGHLADQLATRQVRSIQVTGYTDRIGSQESNLELSRQRAASVRDLLVRRGVPANVISIAGLGAAMPKIECPGPATAHVIECLAPNRRTTLDIVYQ